MTLCEINKEGYCNDSGLCVSYMQKKSHALSVNKRFFSQYLKQTFHEESVNDSSPITLSDFPNKTINMTYLLKTN